MAKHPTQPLEVDDHGTVRFKRNHIVNYLLDEQSAGRRCSLNEIWIEVAQGRLPMEDYVQLMQLVGYSVSGYGDLAYQNEDVAWRRHAGQMDRKADQVHAAWAREHSLRH